MSLSPDDEALQSKVIALLRFPLMVGVVFIHASIRPETNTGLFYEIHRLFSVIIPGVSVPFFFFISGYLFFYKRQERMESNAVAKSCACENSKSEFNRRIYFQKLKTRFRTLLFPYIFWNAAVILLGICQMPVIYRFFNANPIPNDWISVLEYFWASPLCVFWERGLLVKAPISGQFWFIRDLMGIVLLSPILYWGIKKLKFVFFLSLCLLYFIPFPWVENSLLVSLFSIPEYEIACLFFFSFGAAYSIKNRSWLQDFSKFQIPVFILYPICVFWSLICHEAIVHKIQILVGIVFFANLVSRFALIQKNESFLLFLSSSSFFLFAVHMPWLSNALGNLIQKIIPMTTDLFRVGSYFLQILLSILISLITYYFLKRFFPKITNLITGGR